MFATTGNDVDGYRVEEYLGVVRGIVVRAPNIAQGFIGGINQIFGGNIEAYAEVCERARQDAYERMIQHAAAIGANGVIAVRYDATEFTQSVTEVLCYGTAVRLVPKS
jgi:uncharacterized protein YbjQ (UPF0145 family)